MLEDFAATGDKITSTSVPGFWVRRAWLDPEHTPKVGVCVREILRASRRH
jgi:hypothetical protein